MLVVVDLMILGTKCCMMNISKQFWIIQIQQIVSLVLTLQAEFVYS